MPFHGLKSDLELAALVVTAGITSFFVSGQIFSNVLFTFLLASLFFLIGLHLDLNIFKALRQKRRQLTVSLIAVYVLTPIIAYMFSLLPGFVGEVFLVLGVSGAALGSPKIWSNLANADGDLASYTATFSLMTAPLFVPVLLFLMPLELNASLMLGNLPIIAVPFLVGMLAQNYENTVMQDLRIHFSKLAFWLIVLITLVQFRLLFQAEGVFYVSELLVASAFFAAFSLISFGYSHLLGVFTDLYEKESRAIGFIGSSKNVALAFFIAAHLSGEIVLLVGIYYFIRQLMGLLYVDLYVHGESQHMKRLGF